MKIYGSFEAFIDDAQYRLQFLSNKIHPDTWQSMDVSKKPEMLTHEILNFSGQMMMPTGDLDYYRERIKPNLPWADRHFELERVSGEPINPGTTWREWPWGHSADKFRTSDEQFSHSYAERYWPRYAGAIYRSLIPSDMKTSHEGIRYRYGDLDDVVNLLVKHPLTRQAYLPVWFPEDTGVVSDQRVPCSLGYHFIQRGGHLHIGYTLRSCDFYRHFRDDIYLTLRLLLWVLDQLKQRDPQTWIEVKPGMFSMWITSLHLFDNDYRQLYGNSSANPKGA